MGLYYETAQERGMTSGYEITRNSAGEWQRWDEEIVEEFGRWLARIAKACTLLALGVFAAVYIGWF